MSPDISMCPDMQCPQARDCYRSPTSGTVPDPLRQSWLERSPRPSGADRCYLYWSITAATTPKDAA